MVNKIDPALVPKKTLYSGEKIPAIGMGTFGSDRFSAEEVSAAVAGAIRIGYRLFDGAACYENEELIGKVYESAIGDGIVKREELFVTSKLWNNKHDDVEESLRKTLLDLRLSYVDLYFVHWPVPNYHPPGCDVDARSPDSVPFSAERFMATWRQMEDMVDKGLTRYIGMSNMTIKKLDEVLPQCRIKPVAMEMELHPCFQQPELYDYCVSRGIQPIGFCPIGSPTRPDRDKTDDDIADIQVPEMIEIAKNHGVHPAVICLKWAVSRGQIPIPFSIHENEYYSNLLCTIQDPLTESEMAVLKNVDKNCRLIKGQVFLWEGAKDWRDLWDEN